MRYELRFFLYLFLRCSIIIQKIELFAKNLNNDVFSILITLKFTVEKNSTSKSTLIYRKTSPFWGGKSQTAQGERSVTLGISPLNSHNDSHRVDSVSLETDGIVVAMTYPENHCIGEYAIPYRNAISVNAGLRQCSSMSYT